MTAHEPGSDADFLSGSGGGITGFDPRPFNHLQTPVNLHERALHFPPVQCIGPGYNSVPAPEVFFLYNHANAPGLTPQ